MALDEGGGEGSSASAATGPRPARSSLVESTARMCGGAET